MNHFLKTQSVLKIILSLLLMLTLLSACGDSDKKEREQKSPNATVGIVNLTIVLDPVITGLKTGMAEQGYIEGENITYIYDGPVGSIADLDAAVQKLVDADVDVIFSLSTPATLAAQRVTATTHIPVVFGTVTNPVAAGIVDSLIDHKRNITGVATGGSEAKQLEWFHTAIPELQRVFIPYNPNDSSSTQALDIVRAAALRFGIEVVVAETPTPDAVLLALENLTDIDGILILPDSIVGSQLTNIVTISLDKHIPVAGINPDHAEAGILLHLMLTCFCFLCSAP